MTTRVLPIEEWGRLVGTELEHAAPVLPLGSKIIVVEDNGNIVGCWSAITYVHVEGVWIEPLHRGKSAVARRLWRGMQDVLRLMDVRSAMTGSITPEIDALLAGMGAVELPGKMFVFPVKG
jgi:hypothetical protein